MVFTYCYGFMWPAWYAFLFFILVRTEEESVFKAAWQGILKNNFSPFSKFLPRLNCPSSTFVTQLWPGVHPQLPVHARTRVQILESVIYHSQGLRETTAHLLPFHHTAVNRALLLNFLDRQAQAVHLVVPSQLRTRKSFWHLSSLSHPPIFLLSKGPFCCTSWECCGFLHTLYFSKTGGRYFNMPY